jgi:hypothetical protein
VDGTSIQNGNGVAAADAPRSRTTTVNGTKNDDETCKVCGEASRAPGTTITRMG